MTEDGPVEGFSAAPARRTRYGVVVFACAVMFFVCGPLIGVQGIFHAIAQRGVYADRCGVPAGAGNGTHGNVSNVSVGGNGTHLPCRAQQNAIAKAADLSLSTANAAGLGIGILIDFLGGHRVALIGATGWAMATGLAGVAPGSGAVWTTCQCAVAATADGVFTAMLLHHLRHAAGTPREYALWSTCLTGMWGIGAMFDIPLGHWLAMPALPFWLLYAIYGAAAGAFAVIGFVILGRTRQRDPASTAAREGSTVNNTDSSAAVRDAAATDTELRSHPAFRPADAADTTGPADAAACDDRPVVDALPDTSTCAGTWRHVVRPALHATKDIVTTPVYWLIVLHQLVVVTFGYFFIANVGGFARFHGATEAEVERFRQVFTYLMGALALSCMIPGTVVRCLGHTRGLPVALCIQIGWLVVIACVGIFAPLKVQYFTLGVLLVWRTCAFGLTYVSITLLFAHRQAGMGLAMGGCKFLAGIVSMGVGRVISEAVQHDPHRFGATIAIAAIVAAAVDATLACVVPRLAKANSEEEQRSLLVAS